MTNLDENIPIISYKEVLAKIENKENHLLLGNGFNRGLGVSTSYKEIFDKMSENNLELYNDASSTVDKCNFDLEVFIGDLEKDISEDNIFLKKYVRNKVKSDFMQAANEIVKLKVKNICGNEKEGVYLLLKEFTNYFTLNYDMFLYLLLLKYKPMTDNENDLIVFEPNLKFIEDELNQQHKNIYTEIKIAKKTGSFKINFGSESAAVEKDFNKSSKTLFVQAIKEYSKANKKSWKIKDIERVVKSIIEEEKEKLNVNKVDDGFNQQDFFGDSPKFAYDLDSKTQNIFFLHGAFHIYKKGNEIGKITQQSDKALYDKLEDVLNDEDKEIVCVFQNTNKIDEINKNAYLKKCFNKLCELNGSLVIIGSALSDNDDHIFNQINKSDVKSIFISTLLEDKLKMSNKAKSKFPSKELYFFDAKTISYEVPEQNGNKHD